MPDHKLCQRDVPETGFGELSPSLQRLEHSSSRVHQLAYADFAMRIHPGHQGNLDHPLAELALYGVVGLNCGRRISEQMLDHQFAFRTPYQDA